MREYSKATEAGKIFMDALATLGRRGWYMVRGKQEGDAEDSFSYASFHVHPDEAELFEKKINLAVKSLNLRTKWSLKTQKEHKNRFTLLSESLEIEISTHDEFNDALKVYEEKHEERTLAAKDLILLADKLYEMSLN